MSTNCLIKNPKQPHQQQNPSSTQNHHHHHHHHQHNQQLPSPPKQQALQINKNLNEKLSNTSIQDWRCSDVTYWARHIECYSENVVACLEEESIDGQVLMELCEEDIRDLRFRLNYPLTIGEIKKLWLSIRMLQQINSKTLLRSNCISDEPSRGAVMGRVSTTSNNFPKYYSGVEKLTPPQTQNSNNNNTTTAAAMSAKDFSSHTSAADFAVGGGSNVTPQQQCIPPDIFKTMLSLGYSFVVTWITSFVMVIVHERVPDMKRYPPLPDIFLDNVPHIPWAFHMCEITGTLLFMIWTCVCVFHKHRMVLLRRFFALAGTVFLLRCVTMLITSLSVPGTHLQCNQKDYAVDDTSMAFLEALHLRVSRAYAIWSGLGMSIQGVRTCGDYMFSGHTVALTLLNFFITEYTPRNLYFLHTMTWLLNMFGIFFILAAHEHYSIDVFVAFYITSRLFLYYHTLANNQALMSRDSNRTRIWFPMFSYFESSVEGIIPNEYDTLGSLFDKILYFIFSTVDSLLLRARNFWFESTKLGSIQKKVFAFTLNNAAAKPLATNTATNTTPVISNNKSFAQATNQTSSTTSSSLTLSSQQYAAGQPVVDSEPAAVVQKELHQYVTSTSDQHDVKLVKKKL